MFLSLFGVSYSYAIIYLVVEFIDIYGFLG